MTPPFNQSTNPVNHPLTCTPIHRWGSLHSSLIFKQTYCIFSDLTPPGLGVGCSGGPNAYMQGHVWANVCTHTHIKHDTHEVSHLQFLNMYYLASTHVCVHSYIHVGHLHMPLGTPTHLPPPQSWGSHISINAISLELIKIIQSCLKI